MVAVQYEPENPKIQELRRNHSAFAAYMPLKHYLSLQVRTRGCVALATLLIQAEKLAETGMEPFAYALAAMIEVELFFVAEDGICSMDGVAELIAADEAQKAQTLARVRKHRNSPESCNALQDSAKTGDIYINTNSLEIDTKAEYSNSSESIERVDSTDSSVVLQKELIANTKPRARAKSAKSPKKECDMTLFDAFWALYPKRVAKEAARKAWLKLAPDFEMAKQINAAIRAQHNARGSALCCKYEYIPYPATWLNAGSWNDELPPAEATPATNPRTPQPGRAHALETLEEAKARNLARIQQMNLGGYASE